MFCAISGQTPEEPVISLKSGHLFEKRLITKYIEAEGKCPITGQELSLTDVMDVATNKAVKPRPQQATSVPGMLTLFQNEWDAVMLETYTLKQHLEAVRQELSHALYQHDAACRVIARLIKERDAARKMLSNAESLIADAARERGGGAAPAAAGDSMEVDGAEKGMTQAVIKKMLSTSQELSKMRKERVKKKILPPNLASADEIDKLKLTKSSPLHSSQSPGILCMDLHPTKQDLVLTGGADHAVIVFHRGTGKVAETLKGHSKKLTSVQFHPTEDMLVSTSSDKTVRVWRANDKGKFETAHTLKSHTAEVSGAHIHPTNEYVVTGSLDKTWCLHNLETGEMLTKVAEASVTKGYSCMQFHPDGLILGTGTVDSYIRIWDIKTQGNVASFEGHKGQITALSFSENGYYLATSAEDSSVRLWDLRKLENFHTIQLDDGVKVTSLDFDYSGQYLAVGGTDARVYASKTWNLLKTWSDHPKECTSIKFGIDAKFLVTGSLDRNLRVFS
jgi:pre-mRNA-processing factor 19